jgi:hypothetical protein
VPDELMADSLELKTLEVATGTSFTLAQPLKINATVSPRTNGIKWVR